MNKKNITIKVSQEFYDKFRKLAYQNETTLTSLVKKAIYQTYGIKEQEKQKDGQQKTDRSLYM